MEITEGMARRGAAGAFALAWLALLAGSARAQLLDYHIEGSNNAQIGSVRVAGDFDHDGANDFIVGAPLADSDFDGAAGEVTVYSGATGYVLMTFKSTTAGTKGFGSAVAGNGDFDGDGMDDVIVGSYLDSHLAFNRGSLDVYSGGTQQLLLHLDGNALDDFFGYAVDFVGDLDGDGTDEFVVGAPGVDAYVHVVKGDGTMLYYWTGQAWDSLFGWDVRRGGDVNGDGVEDILVGEPRFDTTWGGYFGNVDAGRAIVYSGADGSEILEVGGGFDYEWLGASVAGLGDVNGDGNGDFAAGAPYMNNAGSVSVHSGQNGVSLFVVDAFGPNDLFGWSVSGLGDINGDGIGDLLVGAPGFDFSDVSFFQFGYASTYSGKDGTYFFAYGPWNRFSGDSGFGVSVSGGDIDLDGFGDLVVGFPNFDTADKREGAVDVIRGCPAIWNNYGAGWPGRNGVPSLTLSGTPALGQTITFSIGDSSGAITAGILFIGLDDASIPTSAGGTLLVTPLITQNVVIPATGLDINAIVPGDPTLRGVSFFMQALEVDAAASKKLSFTRGLRVHIGYPYP